MNNLKLFDNLPEGFRIMENEVDHKLISLTVTQAFSDYKYPVPTLPASLSSYMKVYYDISEQWLENAEKYGLVLTNDDYSAAMVLTPIEHTCNLELDSLGKKFAELEGKEVGENFSAVLEDIGKAEEELSFRDGTVYIEALAVQTPRQGQKLGSKLMRKLFEECDKQNRDIFLFTNTEKNAAIYTHFGFETIKKHVADKLGSTTWFMLRRPNT